MPLIDVDAVRELRITFDLSQNKALRIARHFSKKYNIPRAEYLQQMTTTSNTEFGDLFEYTDRECKVPTVVCSDTKAFLERILTLRDLQPEATAYIVGIDKGDDTVKVSITLLQKDATGVPRGIPTGVARFKSSGVKNILLLAASVDDETYESVRLLMNMLDLPPGTLFAIDHKMKSSVCGISGGSATHWCEICTYDRNDGNDYDEEKVQMRTFESMRADYDRYEAAGLPSKRQRDYNNCVRPPMPFLPATGEVWDTIMLSALHLRINIISRIVQAGLDSRVGGVGAIMRTWIDDRLHLLKFAQRNEWTGRDCRSIISSKGLAALRTVVDESLRQEGKHWVREEEQSILHSADLFHNALSSFAAVHTATFGDTVSDDAELLVMYFASAYQMLEITISRTVHVVLRHLVPFCRRHNCGLKPFVEEAHESLHRDFRLVHDRRTRKNPQHPEYSKLLHQAVVTYNSLHSGGKSAYAASSDSPAPPDDSDDRPPRGGAPPGDGADRKHDSPSPAPTPPSDRPADSSSTSSAPPDESKTASQV